MTPNLVKFLILLSCVASRSLADNQISWGEYCNCLDEIARVGSVAGDFCFNCCLKKFFRSSPKLTTPIENYKNSSDVCFVSSKDNDPDCKIVRRFELSSKFQKHAMRLVKKLKQGKKSTLVPTTNMYQFWLHHPDISEICQDRQLEGHESLDPKKFQGDVLTLSNETYDHFIKDNRLISKYGDALANCQISAGMKKQIEMYSCDNRMSDLIADSAHAIRSLIFCELQVLRRFMRKITKLRKLVKTAEEVKDELFRTFYSALRLDIFVYIERHLKFMSAEVAVINVEKVKEYRSTINTIVAHVRDGNIDELKRLMYFLPSDILNCPEGYSKPSEDCYFKQILDQLVTYFKLSDVQIDGKKRIMLSTETNYERLLEIRQMDRILIVVQQNHLTSVKLAEDITSSNNQRFVELRKYFVQLQSFSNNKAKADIGFIAGWIDEYRNSSWKVADKAGTNLKKLLEGALTATIGEAAGKAAKLALAIAEACNPLKAIFGGSSAGDIMAATEEFSVAIGKLTKATILIQKIEALIYKASDLAVKFERNSIPIMRVMQLVNASETSDSVEFEIQKSLFIKKYRAYNPEVQRPELVEVESYWNEVVTAACDIINGLETAPGTVLGLLKVDTCLNLPAYIADMMATYTEIYDFQFDLMETLASGMRAKIGERAAQNIASNFKSLPIREDKNTLNHLNIYTLSYLTYNIQTWNTIKTYCDKLQYAEGGVKPRECQGEKTDLSTLMSRTKRICTRDNNDDVRIPIKPAGEGDRAFLNLTNLYKGKDVFFKIANTKWLVDNEWIMKSEARQAIYVKEFQIFLPTVTDRSTTFISTSMAVGENALTPCSGCPQYILPNVERASKFKEGYEASCLNRQRFPNPYTICKSNPLSEECQITEPTERAAGTLYPSIFASWRINVDGYQNKPIPEPANQDMFIKARIKYCSLPSIVKKSSLPFKYRHKSASCCNGNKYFSSDAKKCTKCPKGSKPNLHGYYCEKNENVLMSK